MAHVQDTNGSAYHEVGLRAPSLDSLNIEDQQREERFQDKVQEYGVEQYPIDIPTPTATGTTSQRARKSPWKIILKMAIFYLVGLALMGGHAGFFMWLDGKAVSEAGISQEYQTTVGNLFAIAAEVSLLAGVGLAYDQFLWRMFRRKSFKAGTIDTLISLAGSPWDLVSFDILKEAAPAAFIGLLCALFPVAAMFPPGAVTVEFVDRALPETLKNVPTMNISDFGDFSSSTHMKTQTMQRSLVELEGSMSFMRDGRNREAGNLHYLNPRLISMANQVLSSGEPVFAPSPCRGPCAYKIPFSGPRFHCEISPDRDGLIPLNKCNSSGMPLVYRAEDKASFLADPDTNPNSFVISWYEDVQADGCGLEFQQTMDCSITLADYQVEIETFQDQSRKFSLDVEREEEIWTKDKQIYTSYWEWFLPHTLNETESLKEFLPKFRAAQTFAISRAATSALQGDLGVAWDGGSGYFTGNATNIVGSPYIGFEDKIEAKFSITPEKIENYLQDLVVSTLALNPKGSSPLWVHNEDIRAMAGANVYVFQDKMHFFVPYALCLAVTAAIYLLGFWSLYKNGVSAESGFLQVAATTSNSAALRSAANGCGAGGEYVSGELDSIRLRFGIHKGSSHGGAYEGAEGQYLIQEGFGTESELER